MRNGKYALVKAPEEYPGKKYQKKYCCEHHLVWWKHHKRLLKKGHCIHHKDGDGYNNNIDNLDEIKISKHKSYHARARGRMFVKLKCPNCYKIFIRQKNRTHLSKKYKATFCSRICSQKFRSKPDKEIRISKNIIKEFRGINIGSKTKPILKNGNVV